MNLLPILLYVILFSPKLSHALWPFSSRRFNGNSLINAGSLGLDSNARLLAFGDFNGDQSLDVLTLDPEQKTITVYLWNHEKFMFQSSVTVRHHQLIKNVVPGDFNNDGRLDLLVMSAGTKGENTMFVYFSDLVDGFKSATQVPSSTTAQPFLIDSNGDMKIDLLGASPTSDPIVLWKNIWNETSGNGEIFQLTDPLFQGSVPCDVSDPHSNAFLDLDGDCLADIFLTCQKRNSQQKTFQIWLNSPERNGFHIGLSGQLPDGIGSVSFADMDRDGTIDMVFPTCESIDSRSGIGRKCSLNIVYNKQRLLCDSSPDLRRKGDCRPPGNLCTKDPDFRFDFSEDSDNDGFVRINLDSFFSLNGLLMNDITYDPPLPIPIRVGDLNLDGYPDIILIGVSKSGNQTPYILNSVQCSHNVAGCGSNGEGRRGFQMRTTGTEIMKNIVDARGVTVMDLDEDGTLDLIIQRTGAQGEGTITFIHNNFFYDAFFLKAMVMNRPCDGMWCEMPNGSTYEAYGVNFPGATYKYTVQDTSGRRSAAQVPQLPQTSYHSLNTPYSFFGLGRTNNYIENLFVGSTKRQDTFINMEGVIPNSKLIIIPPSPGQGSGWKKELFLRPGAWIPWVTLTLVLSTIVLAIIVLILHLNEKREDELERRRSSYHINFDAL